MKKLFSLSLMLVLIALSVCFAFADPAATVTTVAAAVPPAPVSIIDWFRANAVPLLATLLGIGEVMGASPWFKGNGIIDSIIKSLRFLLSKETPPAA